MRAARQAGVRIALGSDRNGVSGDDTALELLRMVHHGLTSAEALVSATSIAAEAIGLQDHIGTITPGRLADIVVVDGDAVPPPSCCAIHSGSGSCSSSARSSVGQRSKPPHRPDTRRLLVCGSRTRGHLGAHERRPLGRAQPLTASNPGPAPKPHPGGVDVFSPEVMSRHTEVPSGCPSGPAP